MENEKVTKFNMSAATLQRLDELLKRASYFYFKGDIPNFFHTIKELRANAEFKIAKKERLIFIKLNKMYSKESDRNMKCGIALKYRELLLDEMEKKGLLLPNAPDDSEGAY